MLEEKYLRGEFSFLWDKDTIMEQENIPPEEKESPAKKRRKAKDKVIYFKYYSGIVHPSCRKENMGQYRKIQHCNKEEEECVTII